ncbi:MAG: transketolase family protein [Spirochaetota bacterium]
MAEFGDPRIVFGEALLKAGEENKNIVAISADSSKGSGLGPFKERFPHRHFEFGIMEQGVIGFAAGLATTGKIPFVAAIAPFVTARPFEMFRNDLGYMRQNVKVIGRCAGMTYSDLGATHQSLDDVAIIRTIPGVTVISPGDPVEIKKAVHAIAKHVGPVYMRIGRSKLPVLFSEDHDFQIGKGVLMKNGNDVTIVASGTALPNAFEASKILEKDGIDARLINIHTIKPLDRQIILRAARETKRIVTVEENYLIGGLGSSIAELLSIECPTPMKMIGVDDQFADTGPYEELLGLYGLQAEQIANTVKAFISQR